MTDPDALRRREALDYATKAYGGSSVSLVLQAAKAFEAYLKGESA